MNAYEQYKINHYELLQSIKRAMDLTGVHPAELCRRTNIEPAHFSKVMNQTPETAYKSFSSLALCGIIKELNMNLTISIDAKANKA